jgi:2-phospho-L-lactate guanylyltransferase
MLDDVLGAIGSAHTGPKYVVTPDDAVDAVALRHDAEVIQDAGHGTNQAIVTALADSRVAAAPAVLVIQGDLPQLNAMHVARCLDPLTAAEPVCVLVAADDGGTSILGLAPPTAMPTAFGPDSGDRHRENARLGALVLEELPISALSADVDTVNDLERVRAHVGPATAAALSAISVAANRN